MTSRAPRCRPTALLAFAAVTASMLSSPPSTAGRSATPDEPAAVHLQFPALDLAALAAEDDRADSRGEPFRFAIAHDVIIAPDTHGAWAAVSSTTDRWQLRLSSPNVTSINLGFSRFHLPDDAALTIRATDQSTRLRPFTTADNFTQLGQLWTPLLPANDITIELIVPRGERNQLSIELTAINLGYRGPHQLLQQRNPATPSRESGSGDSGTCHVDVACPEALAYAAESAAVALYCVQGVTFCTAALITNTAGDQRPYLLTAKHCGANTTIDHTIVVYFNYENSYCREPGTPAAGGAGDGTLTDFSLGTRIRAAHGSSDFLLMELRNPPDPDWNLMFAGWDRSAIDPASTTTIHHPQAQEKRITFDDDPAATTSYGGVSSPGDGTHVRIVNWDLGSTEPGSDGAPLFNPDRRIIGQLHGGSAACGNTLSTWFGRFSHAWTGNGTPETSLAAWLDPLQTGEIATDARSYFPITCSPDPVTTFVTTHSGLTGGPFTTQAAPHQLTNGTTSPIDYEIIFPEDSIFAIASTGPAMTGTLDAEAILAIPVTTAPSAAALSSGLYEETMFIRDVTHDITFARRHQLLVGRHDIAAADVPVPIPDQSPTGITSTIEVTDNFCIDDLDVAITIEHSFIGDLIVKLRGPNGHIITLHDRTGNQEDNLFRIYDDPPTSTGTTPPHGPGALADFNGTSAKGTWSLIVSDIVAQDIGAILNWSLRINPSAAACEPMLPYHVFPLDDDPLIDGWIATGGVGGWSYGTPTGQNNNPPSAATGTFILAHAMDDNYAANIPAPHTLTTIALDCSRLRSPQLRFRRWLGVEGSQFDHATVECSTDGVTFTPVWTNPANIVINESFWSRQFINLSPLADHAPTVYLRWTLGPTDGNTQLHSWNIDDVEIWGIIDCPADVAPAAPDSADGMVNVQDLLAVLAAWGECDGPCPPRCVGDTNGDCIVNVTDLLDVLSSWGPCESQ